jgi:hypothetical protein
MEDLSRRIEEARAVKFHHRTAKGCSLIAHCLYRSGQTSERQAVTGLLMPSPLSMHFISLVFFCTFFKCCM